MEYRFLPTARFQKGARSTAEVAQTVGEHLALIKEQTGTLVPDAVVEEARNPNSPTHGFFEWNNDSAAEQHRLSQARNLIRSVVAVYRHGTDETMKTTRAFVSVEKDDARSYQHTAVAMSDEEMRSQVVRRAWDDLQRVMKKYRDILEFSQLFSTAEEIEKILPPKL